MPQGERPMTRTRRDPRVPAPSLPLLLALCAAAPPAWAAQALKPFTATYEGNYMGLNGPAEVVRGNTGGERREYKRDNHQAVGNLRPDNPLQGQWRPPPP